MSERAQALVVSGFLGAGKTTLVRRLLEEGERTGIRTAVVSNEFGELGIDEALLAKSGGDYVELAGGCVCCRLSDDLLRTLQELWERSRPARVIVETSGLALPYDTLLNFWREPVSLWSEDEMAVAVVSAEQVACGREIEGLFTEQVSSADLLVLSKLDLVSDRDIARIEQRLQELAPGAPIIHGSYGEVDSRVFFPPPPQAAAASAAEGEAQQYGQAAGRRPRPRAATREPQPHTHDDFRSEQLQIAPGVAVSVLQHELQQRSALRVKGFVDTEDGVRLVQGVAGRVEITVPPSPPSPAMVGRLVIIERIRS
jgi:G3E family GTPase